MDKIKKSAKEKVKNNIWQSIIVCFITFVILTFGYRYNTGKRVIKYQSNITANFKAKNNLDLFENYFEDSKVVEFIENYKPTRGVLSVFFNQITLKGLIIIGILNVCNEYLFNNSIPTLIIMLIGLLISFLFYIFDLNIIVVGKNRYFLEHSSYKEVSYERLFFIYQVKK